MRKVKVAAALASVLTAGLLSGALSRPGRLALEEYTAKQAVEMQLVSAPAVTATIEATAVITTTAESQETTTLSETAATEDDSASKSESTATTTATTQEIIAETTEILTAPTEVLPQNLSMDAILGATENTTKTTAADTTAAAASSETTTATKTAEKGLPITESEYIMLCNVVGHEYGSDFVSVADKALVVEVIMNRVNSPLFPNTIYEVLTQPGQFDGLSYLVHLGKLSPAVTDSVKEAVDLYFADPSKFQHGYFYFTGDGERNYFR